MDKNLKVRIIALQIFGLINLMLGLYVLVAGYTFLDTTTSRTLLVLFLGFAGANFYSAYSLRKKWRLQNEESQKQLDGPKQTS